MLDEFWKAFAGTLEGKQGVPRGIPCPRRAAVSSWTEFSGRVLDQQWKDGGTPLEHCEKCRKLVLLQNSKRGLFVGCSGYPNATTPVPGAGWPTGR